MPVPACSLCHGRGAYQDAVSVSPNGEPSAESREVECDRCGGTGVVEPARELTPEEAMQAVSDAFRARLKQAEQIAAERVEIDESEIPF